MIVLEQLKLLVNLARMDGELAIIERNYIVNIGKGHGFPESSVETLFYDSHETILAEDLTPKQRFNYLFNLVQLMKIDEKLYQEEIKFCANIATRLGYKSEIMFDLLLKVKSGPMDQKDIDALQESTAKYLTIQ
jgi:hypothetical protein